MKPFATTLLALLLAVPALAAGKSGAPPDPMAAGLNGPQRLTALVDRVRFEQQQLKTMQANFTQQQESSMMMKSSMKMRKLRMEQKEML